MEMRIFVLLWVLLVIPGWSEAWTHKDRTWKHSNGLSITFPADFQVEASPQGILNVVGKQGFINLNVRGLKGEKDFKGWLVGQRQSFEAEGLKIKGEQTQTLKSGILARTMQTERMSEQGILFVVVACALSKGQDYLCLQFFYPQEREKDWSPLLQNTLNSVTR